MKKIIAYFLTFFYISTFCLIFALSANCLAQPYGKGLYGILKYGNETSLSISTDGDIDIPVTPNEEGVLATDKNNITVTSTDVAGFKLYVRAMDSTNMNNLGSQLPTSENITPLPLTVNTWGYNTNGSNNFIGIGLTDNLIKSVASPTVSGDITSVTYGLRLDMAKPAGNYVVNVVYTAVPQTD